MTALTLCLMAGGIFTAAAAAAVFVAMVRTGQLDDLEETKFRMIREEENR